MASPDRHFANAAIFTHSTGLTPNSGDAALYIKSDNKAYIKDSAGAEVIVGGTGTIAGTLGTVDNAVPRADGTGGVTAQGSGIIIEDTIVSFTGITGNAGTDIITATGSAFISGQPVRFTALTGGTGLNTTTNYFVVNPVGATFQVETSIGGGASLFTTNITAGTLLTGHSVQVNVTLSENTTETNSALVLTPKGTGALIAGPKPDGTATRGNARGANAIDLQTNRSTATQVASGSSSVLSGGVRNTASASESSVGGGTDNSATQSYSTVSGGKSGLASGIGSVIGGGGYYNGVANVGNTASAITSSILGGHGALADRYSMQSHASGSFSNTSSGDAQRARFVLRNKTTTNAAVELFLDGSATRLTIPSGKYLTGTINIAGIKSDGSAEASYIRQFSIKNVAGTTSLVGTVNIIGIDTASLTSISITANDTNDALKVEVTGILSETWRWVAAVDVVEVAYGA